jgi:hypothetical protein
MASPERTAAERRGGAPGWLWPAGVAAALVLYVATLAPDLVWQDAGDYQFQAARLNLSRPGDAVRVHPWFLVVAHFLGKIPLWNYAYAANLASAIGSALAVGNVLLLVRLMTGRTLPAVLAATTLAVGHGLWAYATVAQTYGWAAAMLSALALAAWMWTVRRQVRWMLMAAFVGGMAVSDHMMVILALAAMTVWSVAECVRGRAPWWVLPAGAALWTLGATLYWIVLAGEYARTGSLWMTIRSGTVGQWGSGVFNLADLPGTLGKSAMYVVLNYPTPLALAAVAGAWRLARRRDAFSWLILAMTVLYLGWAARYKVVDPEAFFIPFYVFASVLVGVGVAGMWPDLGACSARPCRWLAPCALMALAVMPVGVYAVLPAAARWADSDFIKTRMREIPHRNAYKYLLQPWKTGNRSARHFAADTFASLPQGAVLFSDSTPLAPLVCLQKLEGVRPDVRIIGQVDMCGAVETGPWSLPRELVPDYVAIWRHVYVVSDRPAYMPPWMVGHTELKPVGPVFEVMDADRDRICLSWEPPMSRGPQMSRVPRLRSMQPCRATENTAANGAAVAPGAIVTPGAIVALCYSQPPRTAENTAANCAAVAPGAIVTPGATVALCYSQPPRTAENTAANCAAVAPGSIVAPGESHWWASRQWHPPEVQWHPSAGGEP